MGDMDCIDLLRTTLMKALGCVVFSLGIFGNAACQELTVGLITQSEESYDGYTLMPVNSSFQTFLLDNCGELVHDWTSLYRPGLMAYLLPNGDLVRAGRVNNPLFPTGGTGGVIERFSWNGDLEWSCWLSSDSMCQHHDFAMLPNGNVLAILWKAYPEEEWVALGRNPNMTAPVVWATCIQEIEPTGTEGGNIVWQWEAIDHVVQDFDETKPNYHDPSSRPRQIDVNFATTPNGMDWLHANSIEYHPELDQILISSRGFSEVWILDHSVPADLTSSDDGDLLYRWGNPEAYGRGTASDRTLFKQHDAHWMDNGQIMTFSNGNDRPEGPFSTVEIFTPNVDQLGNYPLDGAAPWPPASSDWRYPSEFDPEFYAPNTSGAQMLPNGNLLITEGNQGDIREVNGSEEIVWRYINPVSNSGSTVQGDPPYSNGVFQVNRYPAAYPPLAGMTLTGQGVLEVTDDPPECTLYPEPSCVNDLNGNYVVDVADVLLVLADFGCTSGCSGDLNGDDAVSVSDVLALLAAFGMPCPY